MIMPVPLVPNGLGIAARPACRLAYLGCEKFWAAAAPQALRHISTLRTLDMANNIVLEFWPTWHDTLAALVQHAYRLDFRCRPTICAQRTRTHLHAVPPQLSLSGAQGACKAPGHDGPSLLLCRKPPDAAFKKTSLALLAAARAGMPKGTIVLF